MKYSAVCPWFYNKALYSNSSFTSRGSTITGYTKSFLIRDHSHFSVFTLLYCVLFHASSP